MTYSADGWGDNDYAFSQGSYAYVMVPYPETIAYAQELAQAVLEGQVLTQENVQNNAPKP